MLTPRRHRARAGASNRCGLLPLVVLAIAVAVALSACGGGSPQTSGVASLGTTTTTAKAANGAGSQSTHGTHPPSTGNTRQDALDFSRCMRSHGITDFPDPGTTGSLTFNMSGGPNVQSAQFEAAQRACRKYLPAGGATPAKVGPSKAMLLRYANCMRAHGVTDFPDPVSFPMGTWGFKLVGQVTQTSPTFQAANQKCSSRGYGGIHPCGGTGGSRRSGGRARRC